MDYNIDYYLNEKNSYDVFSKLIEDGDFLGIEKLLRIFKDSHREDDFIHLLLYEKNKDNITNFDLALKSNNKFIIKALVYFECGTDKNLLHFAISNENKNRLDINFNIAKKILEQESLKDIINIKNNYGCTPIYLAILHFEKYGYEMVEMLLKQNNLNINLTNKEGRTPLDIIIERSNGSIKKFNNFINEIKNNLKLTEKDKKK